MTLAIRFESDSLALALALQLPPLRWQFDAVLWSLAGALLVATGGLVATAALSLFVAGAGVWLPALMGAFGGLWWAVELFFAEVRRGQAG